MVKVIYGKDSYVDLRGRRQVLPVCPVCQIILDPYGQPFPGRARAKYDLSATTEDMNFVSPRLRVFLEETCTSPLEFFPTGSDFCVLRPKEAVYLDLRGTAASHTQMCKACGELNGFYASAGHEKLLPGQRPVGPMDMVRSHQRFGTLRQLSFALIVGDELLAAMKAEKFKGIYTADAT